MLFPIYFRKLLSLIVVILFRIVASADAGELEVLSNVQLVSYSEMDGDSFQISNSGSKLHIRLYFIDCPEITAASKNDARRVREQTRYFGLSHPVQSIHYGKVAKDFVANLLSEPFTVYTSYANAIGRSSIGRFYAKELDRRG